MAEVVMDVAVGNI